MQPPRDTPNPEPEGLAAPALPRQRWRVTYRRRPDAPALAQREQALAWEACLVETGLPCAGLDLPAPRPRLVMAAPLAVGMAAEGELLDIFLVERRPVADVRERLVAALPAGHDLVALHDVWLGEPPLSGQVVAADYRVSLVAAAPGDGSTAPALDGSRLTDAAANLIAAPSLPRARDKGGRSIAYDLRPLVVAVDVVTTDPPHLRIRTRFDPERGVGRPEEVVAALAELAGTPPPAIASIVRERLVLAGDDERA